MQRQSLLLRQRKLLYLLQHSEQILTGAELAKQLETTSRTIRSDISVLNETLAPLGAKIESIRSKGYLLKTQSPEALQALVQSETALISREERVRRLAVRLCLADEPLNAFDLEEEMFISRSTMENDVRTLRKLYGGLLPLFYQNGELFFAPQERGRRQVLATLFSETC